MSLDRKKGEKLRITKLLIRQRSKGTSQVALGIKNPPANAGDSGDAGSIPGSGRPLEEGTATHSSILAWRISWTEEPGGSMGLQSWT